jgi:hypothetical protein
MVSQEVLDRVSAYYSIAQGGPDELVASFEHARETFVHDDIEWHEPFGVINGAENVQTQLIRMHTEMLGGDLAMNAAAVFPSGPDRIVVTGQSDATLGNGQRFLAYFVHIWTFEGDRATKFETIQEEGSIQRALGIPMDSTFPEVGAALMAAKAEGDAKKAASS